MDLVNRSGFKNPVWAYCAPAIFFHNGDYMLCNLSGAKYLLPSMACAIYVVQSTWCAISVVRNACGAIDVVHSAWSNLCVAIIVV
eukprot:8457743-Pyramimonas_sp.AAC.1